MGLIDILNGMQNGPRGQRQPSPQGGSGGMSPMMMALLGLLAYKAIKGGGLGNMLGGGQPGGTRPTSLPGGSAGADSGGGLGDLLGGLLGGQPGGLAPGGTSGGGGGLGDLLGGLLGGAGGGAAGNVLGSGLNNLIRDLQASGQSRVADSWVGTGPNQDIAPDDLAKALGADTIDALSAQTGLPRDELLEGLSQQLPQMVDQLTPAGRLPTEQESSRWV